MSTDVRKSSQDFGQETTGDSSIPVDFDFLATQTFGDETLEREVLDLFLRQARRLVAGLAALDAAKQADAAHLLRGSARGIGAFALAELTLRYEAADAAGRAALHADMASGLAAAERAILGHLAALGRSTIDEGDET